MDKGKQDISKKPEIKKADPKKGEAKKTDTKKVESKKVEFPFTKGNYTVILIGLGILALGFLLLIGGGSDDPNKFSYALFNFRRMKVAPVLIALGYLVEIYAIMMIPKTTKEN